MVAIRRRRTKILQQSKSTNNNNNAGAPAKVNALRQAKEEKAYLAIAVAYWKRVAEVTAAAGAVRLK